MHPSLRRPLFSALVALCVAALWVSPAAADDIDHPTRLSEKPLNGSMRMTGVIDTRIGFPSHEYTASKEGFVRVEMETKNLPTRSNDNGGVAWRPYLRIISISSEARHGEAWSTNGDQLDKSTGKAALFVRVKKGERFTVIASLAQNFVKKKPDANATYTLVVTEVSL
jgi:hypothetical protein